MHDCRQSTPAAGHAWLRHTLVAALAASLVTGCIPKPPMGPAREPVLTLPDAYQQATDSSNSGLVEWREFFTDPHLVALIETAMQQNQELNIAIQETIVANAEIMARRGEYLPTAGFGIGAGVERVGEFTSQGRSDEMAEIGPTLGDFEFGLYASWEIDVWGRLRNLASAATYRYLASVEGRNFMVTRLVAEIASGYYELLALDEELRVVTDNIELQDDALQMVQRLFQAGATTSLALTRFEAELRNMQSAQYAIQQRIVETEAELNLLAGRYPQPIERASGDFLSLLPPTMAAGVPSELLANRPDIRQAELELAAAGLDVDAARAVFYPSLGIEAGIGYQSFDATRLINTPDSLLFGLFGKAFAPLLNRRGITADYYSANSAEMQAVLEYERRVLTATVEVSNRLSLIRNLQMGYELKEQQVQQLAQSIDIATQLFNAGRADYLEVLTTRRESLDAQQELIEMKQQQLAAAVTLYQALGGGWRGTGLQPTDGASPDNVETTEGAE